MEVPPRIRMFTPPPGSPESMIWTPATLPWMSCSGLTTRPVWNSSALVASATSAESKKQLYLAKLPPAATGAVDFVRDIQPIFAENCVSCHGETNPAANYSMTTYEGVLGSGSDGTPNAIPGDAESLLLQKSRVGGSMNAFYGSPEEVELVERWVVEDSLARR